jgi:ligand-binding sensor domain-containing protein
VYDLTEDRDGNLWVGTYRAGLSRISREQILSVTEIEGASNRLFQRIVEDRAGNLYATLVNGGVAEIRAGRATFIPGSLRGFPSNLPYLTAAGLLQDHRGDWWVTTTQGVFRFKGPRLQFQSGERFTAADGIAEGGGATCRCRTRLAVCGSARPGGCTGPI